MDTPVPATHSRGCSLTALRRVLPTWSGRLRTRRRLAGRQRAACWARERCSRPRVAGNVLQRDKQLVQLWHPAAHVVLATVQARQYLRPAPALFTSLYVLPGLACCLQYCLQCKLAHSRYPSAACCFHESLLTQGHRHQLHPLARSSSQRCANSFGAWLRAISLADACSASCASGKTASD